MNTKRVLLTALCALASSAAVTLAYADADDAAWIKRCVSDNRKEGASPTVVAAYCSCMNGKMSSDETLSITSWEKTHPTEMASCEAEAGWK